MKRIEIRTRYILTVNDMGVAELNERELRQLIEVSQKVLSKERNIDNDGTAIR